jgi:membrane protease YdiL (CAAX protease family)
VVSKRRVEDRGSSATAHPGAAGRSKPARKPGKAPSRLGYADRSMDPLHILLFVLPLVAFYEATLFLNDLSGVRETVAAHEIINRFLEAFGDFALYLPGILLLAVLLVMKVARGDAWRVRWKTIPLMAFESVVWAIPLLVIAALLSGPAAVQIALMQTGTEGAEPSVASFPLLSRIALSIGAGLYEEMLFRLLLVSLGAFVFRRMVRIGDTWSAGIAIAIAAMAFTFYHQVSGDTATVIARRLVYFVAGCFLG